jgi:hypothetical protein
MNPKYYEVFSDEKYTSGYPLDEDGGQSVLTGTEAALVELSEKIRINQDKAAEAVRVAQSNDESHRLHVLGRRGIDLKGRDKWFSI